MNERGRLDLELDTLAARLVEFAVMDGGTVYWSVVGPEWSDDMIAQLRREASERWPSLTFDIDRTTYTGAFCVPIPVFTDPEPFMDEP